MSRLTVDDIIALKVGDIRYECDMGCNIEFEVLTAPHQIGASIMWKGQTTNSKRIISFMARTDQWTYAPKIYTEPQYIARRKDGTFYTPLLE